MRKLGRRLWGMYQTWLNAFWVAPVMPRPASSEPIRPIASARPLPLSEWTLFCSWLPMIGNWLSVECRTLSCALGLPCSTNPSTVTNTSSSGNSEKKP